MLEPVDEVVVTTLVDNVYDALLERDGRTGRVSFDPATTDATQYEDGTRAGPDR